MVGICEGGNEPPGSLKAICKRRALRDILMELKDGCEEYAMKTNTKKTKIMIIGRKIKKVSMLIRNEAVEQVDSFKYLECTYYM
ncbi:hypothetical protein ANN_08741 [Periplaneta americana]|uniref:Uncharacterized protein n=1 Tax=Periplaneta americana TaxID=6978 RepID=A0ABQ8T4J4_PERAM|nr:hypothetical protein ANN_08741 [Periplaneta americana]